jgi:uncharacterized protein YqgC (DUF456 family)
VAGLIYGLINASQLPTGASQAAQAGAAIGVVIGMGMWVIVWLVIAGPALVIFLVSAKKNY